MEKSFGRWLEPAVIVAFVSLLFLVLLYAVDVKIDSVKVDIDGVKADIESVKGDIDSVRADIALLRSDVNRTFHQLSLLRIRWAKSTLFKNTYFLYNPDVIFGFFLIIAF